MLPIWVMFAAFRQCQAWLQSSRAWGSAIHTWTHTSTHACTHKHCTWGDADASPCSREQTGGVQQAQQLPPAAPGVQLALPSMPVPPLPQSCKHCCCSCWFLWELSRKTRLPVRQTLVWLPKALQRAVLACSSRTLHQFFPWQHKGVKRFGSKQARSNSS